MWLGFLHWRGQQSSRSQTRRRDGHESHQAGPEGRKFLEYAGRGPLPRGRLEGRPRCPGEVDGGPKGGRQLRLVLSGNGPLAIRTKRRGKEMVQEVGGVDG